MLADLLVAREQLVDSASSVRQCLSETGSPDARAELEAWLSDSEVPVDTNHLERGLRVLPLGRRNWLSCWTEVGAETVGIVQSPDATRLQGVDPRAYLEDVLQRVSVHPSSRRRARAEAAEGPVRRRSDEVGPRNRSRMPRLRSAGRRLNPGKSEQDATSQFSRLHRIAFLGREKQSVAEYLLDQRHQGRSSSPGNPA